MKTIFITNPNAGNGIAPKYEPEIRRIASENYIDFEIIRSQAPGEIEKITGDIVNNADRKQGLRIFACGGDGSLNEVVNGIGDNLWVEVGCIPVGSGNDFVRNFQNPEKFLDIEEQLSASAREINVFQYSIPKIEGSRTALNLINAGFDSNTVQKMQSIKNFFNKSSSWTYFAAVFITLIKKEGIDVRLEYDDEIAHDGKLLLVATGKGRFYGGGIMALPKADIEKSGLDSVFVKNISRRKFIRLFKSYKNGSYLNKKLDRVVEYRKTGSLKITSNNNEFVVASDGELFLTDEIKIWDENRKIKFISP